MAAITDSVTATTSARRVSWGAIFAGVVITLVTQVVLSVLGIAIGASTIDPLQETNPVAGIGMGSGIYLVVSSIISLFAGGYTAGALATVQTHRDRTLHGLTTWGVATVLLLVLLTSGLGRLIGGTMNLVGAGLQTAGQAAGALAQPIAGAVGDQLQEADIDLDLDTLRREATQLLNQTGTEELQPGAIEQDASAVGERAADAAERIARNPQAADEEIQRLFDRIQQEGRETLQAADRDALANVLERRMGMSRAEAEQTVANWEQAYREAYATARQQWEQAKQATEEKAREWGATAAEATAKAAWWTFFVLLLGAIAAAVGANVGANRATVVVRESVHR